jgi:hypothetical protein
MWHGVLDIRRWLDNLFDALGWRTYIRLTTDRLGPRARMQGYPYSHVAVLH